MKTYTKIHSNKTAAENHLKKIKKRGGIAKLEILKDGFQIDYYFPGVRNKTHGGKKILDHIIAKNAGLSVKEYKGLHPETKEELIANYFANHN
jgi:hypothetical protein